jgi:putative hydrolase of the HAD superfamily
MRRRGLIFDFDGLIVDTESAIYAAWSEVYQSHGEGLDLPDYVRCVGSTFGQFDPMAELERRLGRTLDWAPLLDTKNARIRAGHVGIEPLPGVRELLIAAEAADVPCAVASSSSTDWVGRWLDECRLRSRFRAIWTLDRVTHVKPAPDLFLGAARELGFSPGECLVLEDSHNGLLAAQAAGCPCVIVPSPVTRVSDFAGAERVLTTLAGVSLEDLLAGTAQS